MAAFRLAGGPGGRGNFRVTWQGATVLRAIDQATQRAMDAEASEVLSDLVLSIHRKSGEMAEKAFAVVEIRGGKRALVAGSEADHAVYEEIRHPQIRKVMDRHVGHVPPRIREALGGGGR